MRPPRTCIVRLTTSSPGFRPSAHRKSCRSWLRCTPRSPVIGPSSRSWSLLRRWRLVGGRSTITSISTGWRTRRRSPPRATRVAPSTCSLGRLPGSRNRRALREERVIARMRIDRTSHPSTARAVRDPSGGAWRPAYARPSRPVRWTLAVCLLGRFRLFRRGQLVESWHGSKTPRVVRYLFAQRGRPAPRDVLIDLFWPDVDPETARRSLHQAIYVIRKALRASFDPKQLILFVDDAYAVNTSAGVRCDAEEFEACARAGRRAERELREEDAISAYESAERNYAGEFLEDSPYEDWAMAERDRLRLVYLDVANRLAELKLAKGDVEAALDFSQRALRRDSCDEAAHRSALRCYGASGNRNLVIRQYEACVDALDRAYGLAPPGRRPSCMRRSWVPDLDRALVRRA